MQPAEILQKETTFPELLQVFEQTSELAEKEELSDIIYLAFSAGFFARAHSRRDCRHPDNSGESGLSLWLQHRLGVERVSSGGMGDKVSVQSLDQPWHGNLWDREETCQSCSEA